MAESPGVLIVEARYYDDVADELAAGAIEVLNKAQTRYQRMTVPGVFEVPAAVRFSIRAMEVRGASRRYNGFIALGCVIRGETDHYEHICREASRALMDIALDYSVALGFGILTCNTHKQAMVRARVDKKNKGAEAARACLRMLEIKRELRLLAR